MKNDSDSIALVAAALVILEGSIWVGTGAIAEALPEQRGLQLGGFAELAGKVLLIGGGLFFVWFSVGILVVKRVYRFSQAN